MATYSVEAAASANHTTRKVSIGWMSMLAPDQRGVCPCSCLCVGSAAGFLEPGFGGGCFAPGPAAPASGAPSGASAPGPGSVEPAAWPDEPAAPVAFSDVPCTSCS